LGKNRLRIGVCAFRACTAAKNPRLRRFENDVRFFEES
jgi:hypothetical protein